MNISFFTTIKDELEEIKRLLPLYQKYKKPNDEIVILMDTPHDLGVENYLRNQSDINLYIHSLNNDFAQFKNYGMALCSKDYILNLDADELPSQYILENIHKIIESNHADVFWFPRINTVEGLTPELAAQFGYNLNERGYINYPDWQQRCYRNNYPKIHWEKPVHERLVGFETHTFMPEGLDTAELVAIKHPKTIERQIRQNKKYMEIIERK